MSGRTRGKGDSVEAQSGVTVEALIAERVPVKQEEGAYFNFPRWKEYIAFNLNETRSTSPPWLVI